MSTRCGCDSLPGSREAPRPGGAARAGHAGEGGEAREPAAEVAPPEQTVPEEAPKPGEEAPLAGAEVEAAEPEEEPEPVPEPAIEEERPAAASVRKMEARLPARFPALKGVKLAEAWAGMIDVTPDAVPTLGEDEAIKGFYIATGLSGHGFGIGPAVGRIMADLMEGRAPGHDLSRFRPTRFFDGSEIVPGPY